MEPPDMLAELGSSLLNVAEDIDLVWRLADKVGAMVGIEVACAALGYARVAYKMVGVSAAYFLVEVKVYCWNFTFG